MGFFRDLFGPSKPCDVCQLGKGSWPKEHNGIADWKLRGHGLSADLLVCGRCRAALMKSGLMYGNPFAAMASLVRAGVVDRPPVHAYLQHPEWRRVSMHVLDVAGATVPDEFAALEALKAVEASLFGPLSPVDERRPTPGLTVQEFRDVLYSLWVDAGGVFRVPWGSSRERFLQDAPDVIQMGVRGTENRSPRILGCRLHQGDRAVKMWFVFGDSGLSELTVEPENPVPDARSVLSERFGPPVSERTVSGMSGPEYRLSWRGEGLEVQLEQTRYSMANITFSRALSPGST